MAALKAVVLAGLGAAMDKIERWRVVDLCRWVEERWGVSYSETGMLRLLWSLDLSHRKTRPERELIRARIGEARERAKARGVKLGPEIEADLPRAFGEGFRVPGEVPIPWSPRGGTTAEGCLPVLFFLRRDDVAVHGFRK